MPLNPMRHVVSESNPKTWPNWLINLTKGRNLRIPLVECSYCGVEQAKNKTHGLPNGCRICITCDPELRFERHVKKRDALRLRRAA